MTGERDFDTADPERSRGNGDGLLIAAHARGLTGGPALEQPAARLATTPTRTRLTLQLRWGQSLQATQSFQDTVLARDFPLWGTTLSPGFVLAEPCADGGFTLHLPDGARRLAPDERGNFPLGAMTLVASVDAVLEALPHAPLVAGPTFWLAAVLLVLLFGGMALVPAPAEPPFEAHDTRRIITLVARLEPKPVTPQRPATEPPRPTERPKQPSPARQPVRTQPAPGNAVSRLLGGRGLQQLLGGMKTPSGNPGGGKHQPSLFAGLSPGVGRATGPAIGISAEGGPGIGAAGLKTGGQLATGNYGRGKVWGSVEVPSGNRLDVGAGAKGLVDRDAVARVIAEHLHEVSTCYEHALLTNGRAGGRLQLEWTISTGGEVTQAKVQSTTLKDGTIASCVLSHLKGWRFPKARGAAVLVSYPFVFQATDF
jgi:hypothetical protein